MAISGLHFFDKLKVLFMKKFLFFLPLILLSCVGNPKVDYSQMSYNDIPREEFEKLPYDIQYSIKYKDVPENQILVECIKKDTVYDAEGNMVKTEYVPDTFLITMTGDSMLFFVKQKCLDPYLDIYATEELYIPEHKEFLKDFSLRPKYDKQKKAYYLLKNQFPKFERNAFGVAIYGMDFDWTPAKNSFDRELYLRNDNYYYRFTESKFRRKGSLGNFNGSPLPARDEFECVQNQITAFLRWITGDLTYQNQWTDK